MDTFYPLLIKNRAGFETVEYHKNYEDALRRLKELAVQHLPLAPLWDCIRGMSEQPLAPQYRKSVMRFWEDFFSKEHLPSKQLLDFSDYKGKNVTRLLEEEWQEAEDGIEFDEGDAWDELSAQARWEPLNAASPFDKKLKFAFFAIGHGACLCALKEKFPVLIAEIGKERDDFLFTLHFEETKGYDAAKWDLSILKKAPKQTPLKTANSLMVLECLIRGEALPIHSIVNSIHAHYGSYDYAPYEISTRCATISERTVYRHIKQLKLLGYHIQTTENPEIQMPASNRCREGIATLWNGTCPAPIKRKKEGKEGWDPTLFPVIILATLQLCEKPLPAFSNDPGQETLQKKIKELYGTLIDRKAIGRHINALEMMGYPIQRNAKGVYLDYHKDVFVALEKR